MSVDTSVTDGVGRLVLNHPPLNILTRDVLARFRDEFSGLIAHTELRVLILSAEGKHFSAGADVAEHLPPDYEAMIPEFLATVEAVATSPVPVVAAVRGRCLGGGFELVQAADIVVAGDGATFGQPEILLGVFAPAACALLPSLMAPGVAAEILFTGDAISARRALEAGFAQRVVADEAVEREAMQLAERMARHSAAALRATKRALRAGREISRTLARVGELYRDELMQTNDATEGLQAFLEKRKPVWSHR